MSTFDSCNREPSIYLSIIEKIKTTLIILYICSKILELYAVE